MERIDWHAGFVPAMKLELREYEEKLAYEDEYYVDNRGHRIDLLIIKNEQLFRIPRCIGEIFDKYNIIEYKSPDDNPNLGDFYNTIAYACLYLRDKYEYDVYGRDAFTVTVVSTGYPRKLFGQLKRDGIEYTVRDSGIYVLDDMIPFKTQIIVVRELPKEYPWLRKLTKKGGTLDVKDLDTNTEHIRDNRKYKSYADIVADIFFSANYELLYEIDEMEDKDMCESVERFFAEKHKGIMEEKDRLIKEQEAQISKKDEQIEKLKKQIAKLQSQSAVL